MSDLDSIVEQARSAISATSSIADLEQAKARFLGKSGALTERLKSLGKLAADERPRAGAAINEAKDRVEALVQAQRDAILARDLDRKLAAEAVDVTLPGRRQSIGGLHPIARAQEQVERLFATMGFSVADGPEIEEDYYNFTALRMFPNHPSRSMQDTFYIAGSDRVLRTQTSPVQIRYMQSHKPPIRIICPGRVYRNDHDATHSPMFHQIEGLWIDEGISLATLKATVTQFCRAFFEREDLAIRFRPSYFPFVEPGVEIDMEWSRKDGQVSYLEIAGAGVVHPDVLRNGGIDPDKYS
ncbi:MAG: phenylalanine--tRNA ligase subunit alpha, partial [Bacillota bacterium]